MIKKGHIVGTAVAVLGILSLVAFSGGEPQDLERRVSVLETKVERLEQTLASGDGAPSSSPLTGSWQDRSNWRSLSEGMSYADVRRLLGEPRRISGGSVTRWEYAPESFHAYVSFYDGRVYRWTEPR